MAGTTSLLENILVKICKRYEKRGSLTGIMKLGQDLADVEQSALQDFFGLEPLTQTARNELKLSFDRLFARKEPAAREAWLDLVYQQVHRPRTISRVIENDPVVLFLNQFRLEFPRLRAIHAFLAQNSQSFATKLQKRPEHVRALFFNIGEIVEFLQKNVNEITLSELGARFCSDSKRLRHGEPKKILFQWLHLLRPRLLPEEVWDDFLVIRDRLTIKALIYAPLIYTKNGHELDWINQLYQAGEPALVNWFHLENADSFRLDAGMETVPLITCENEAPFSQLLRDEEKRCVLFTSGFPNRAVRKLYNVLAPLFTICKHWGDSDPAGLRIAAILHVLHPLQLWRCDLDSLKQHRGKLLTLGRSQSKIASTMLQDDPPFPFAKELAFTQQFGWLEQERWVVGKHCNVQPIVMKKI